MSIDITELPQQVLGQIFSHLDPQDLGRVAQVCRSWNTASKPEWIWQRVAQSILDLSEPPKGSSWKEQCLTLRRWETWEPQEFLLSSSLKCIRDYNALDQREFFTLLEDSTAFEIVRLDPSRLGILSVRDLFDHKELCQINLGQYGCDDIFQGEKQGTMLVIRNMSGKIFQFDIRTGACINQFIGEAPRNGKPSALCCNDHEIISSVLNRVQIWDLHRRQLSQSFHIEGRDIWKIRSTPNFILCLAYQPESLSIIAINKKNQAIQAQIEVGFNVTSESFQTSGSYCAILMREGRDLLIYEDTPGATFQLVRTHDIHRDIPNTWGSTLRMYKNWACVYADNRLYIFDVRNGREMVSLQGNWGTQVSFQVNAQALLAFHQFFGTHHMGSSQLNLYDFSGKVHQRHSSTQFQAYAHLS